MKKLSIEGLRSLMKEKSNFVTIFGMFGCDPCAKLEELIGDTTHIKTELGGVPLYYLKLRPSAYRGLKDQRVLSVVPTVSCFLDGKRQADFEGHYPSLTYEEFEATLQNEYQISC